MLDDKNTMLGKIFDCLGESLDIPPSKYQQAVDRYTAVGKHLEGGEYSESMGVPAIYTQGSFRLGTVTRPYREGKDADYDIDLVCDIRSPKNCLTPEQVKQEVGKRLDSHGTYSKLLDQEGRRCWTLEYAEEDGVGFHLDVLPALPESRDVRSLLETAEASQHLVEHSIAITDKRKDGTYAWDPSNPLGYGLWFDVKNQYMFNQVATLQKRLIAEATTVYASVDQVPDQLVRTPLQRLIQLLKRHRDVRFDGRPNSKERPISIIITTLAAEVYRNEANPWLALENFVIAIENYATTRVIHKRAGEWYIPNPTNLAENFADRWNDAESGRAHAFFEWVGFLREDLLGMLSLSNIQEINEQLQPVFGVAQVKAAFAQFGESLQTTSSTGNLSMLGASGLLGTGGGTPVRKHNFYAD